MASKSPASERTCNCKIASSAVRPAIKRDKSASLRRDVLKFAVDDLCCSRAE